MSSAKWKNRIRKIKAGPELEQAAALPYRFENGSLEILLLTTRNTRRFTLPKGWPMKRKSLAEAARVEALEETGLEGILAPDIIGHFFYWKRLKSVFIPVKVSVFPLFVLKELSCWQEQNERFRKWLSPDEAQLLVDEPELVSLIGLLDCSCDRTGSGWEICARAKNANAVSGRRCR